MNKRILILSAVVLVTLLSITSGVSAALAATDSGTPSWSVAGEEFIREGIPMPLIDPDVEGWFSYLGNGEFVTELGRTFYWRDGRFVNSDGTAMGLPPAAEAHLNSLGVYRQPNAEDLTAAAEKANAIGIGGASQDQGGTTLGAASYTAWTGRYLHVGKVWTNYQYIAGNKATITVHDRSPGKAEYYGIGMSTVNYPGHQWNVGLEFCDIQWTDPNTSWVPTVHAIIDGVHTIKNFPSFAFNTVGSEGSVLKTLKMAVKSDYQMWFYLDDVRLQRFDWTNYIQWNQDALARTQAESAYEIGSNSTTAPHATANHHSDIRWQRWIGDTGWPLQTGACSRDEYYIDYQPNPPVVQRPGAYPYLFWLYTPWYDWMARSGL